MSTGLLEQRINYPNSGYEYGYGAGGTIDANNNGRKEIDCSHLLNRMLRDAGYTIPYRTTGQLATDTTHFEVIPLASVQAGDIALWTGLHHTGVIEEMDITRTKGTFFGSQTSTGPKSAKYGAGSGYWPMPNTYLRPKAQYRTGGQPMAVPEPAPAVAPEGSPVMNFQFPIRKADGKQFTGAQEIYKALEKEVSGHYLLGNNQFWHGGIHISDISAPQCIKDDPVRCMADGEVVAYRLNKDYVLSTFGEGEAAKTLKYSNSFCLVRHEYKSPKNPVTGPDKDKQNTLTFYSLYMHLLPFDAYPLAPDELPKSRVKMTVGDFNAYDQPAWVTERQPFGKLATGTELEILDERDKEELTYALGRIISGKVTSGSTKTRDAGDEVWFVYKKHGDTYKNAAGKAIWVSVLAPERHRPDYWQGIVKARVTNKLPLYAAPASPLNGQPAGSPLGTKELCTDSVIQFDSQKVLLLTLGNSTMRMAECTCVSGGLRGAGLLPTTFWAPVDNVPPARMVSWETVTPSTFDNVVITSVGIKAGDPIGYLGLNEVLAGSSGGVTSKHQVHVEIFSADQKIEDFLKNKAGLRQGKKFIYLPVGAALIKKAPQTGTVSITSEHAIDLSKAPIFKDSVEWYEVTVQEGAQSVSGLIKKAEAQLITQHDWEKQGFRIVKETNAASDGFLDLNDMPHFFKTLCDDVDRLGNRDGKVTAEDLPEALKNADMREHWSKLIAYHPTEWKDDSDTPKWARLHQFLDASPQVLKHEKDRIDKLIFWDALSGDAKPSKDGLVWHFHPIGFLGNFISVVSELVSYDQMRKMFPSSSEEKREEVRWVFNKYANRFEINTPVRIAQFFAQVKTEVGSALVGKKEDLWYSVAALRSKFGRYFNTYPAEAEQFGYKRIEMSQYNALSASAKSAYTIRNGKAYSQFANEDAIARRIYCCCSAQGSFVLRPGGCVEGISYKGKGFIQLTWKSNYKAVEDVLKEKLPEELIDMVANPDQLLDTKIGLLSAMGFWELKKLNDLVAPNVESTNKITEIVNKHTNSYAERRNNFTLIYQEIAQ